MLDLYFRLEFGDPAIPRSIPAYLLFKYYPKQSEDTYIMKDEYTRIL